MTLLDAALRAVRRPWEPGLSSRPVPLPVPAFIAPEMAPQYRLGQARVAMRIAADLLRSIEGGQHTDLTAEVRSTARTLEELAETLEIEQAQKLRAAAGGEL